MEIDEKEVPAAKMYNLKLEIEVLLTERQFKALREIAGERGFAFEDYLKKLVEPGAHRVLSASANRHNQALEKWLKSHGGWGPEMDARAVKDREAQQARDSVKN